MKGTEESSKTVWLVGTSDLSRTLGAALCGLGHWGPQAHASAQELAELGDLEELLFGQSERGTLILDYSQVPVEDIGFVRRFLERHAHWRLLVLGRDASDDCAERLLRLGQSEWVSWPPNLDQVSALLPAGTGTAAGAASRATNAASERPSAPQAAEALQPLPPAGAPVERSAPQASGAPSSASVAPGSASDSVEALDLGKLFKELLINEHLAGHKWALEFQEGITLPIDPRLAKLSYGAFINLARACAGREGLVRAKLERSGLEGDPADTVCLQMTFPQGSLSPEDLPLVLKRPIEMEGKLGSAAKAALIAAEALRKRGGRIQLQNAGTGSLQLDMHLSSADLEVLELERLEAASEANEGRAQDPFA